MEDLGFKQKEPTVLWEDNMACIYMSQTSVSSAEQVADSLTKSMPKPAFEKHLDAMLGTSVSTISPKVIGDSVDNDCVNEMEGIELEAKGCEEAVESGLSALEVPKFKARWYARGDAESVQSPPPLKNRLFVICAILILGLYCRFQEYDDDLDFRLEIHYAQCMEWMRNAEFGDFHVFPPWERDIDQCDMQVSGA
eukprot:3095259-Rhodomonas_salina.1